MIETIEELSEEVKDEEAILILEEVSDEIGDISERLQREALVNIHESSKNLEDFSTQITDQASKVSLLDNFLREQVIVNQFTMQDEYRYFIKGEIFPTVLGDINVSSEQREIMALNERYSGNLIHDEVLKVPKVIQVEDPSGRKEFYDIIKNRTKVE